MILLPFLLPCVLLTARVSTWSILLIKYILPSFILRHLVHIFLIVFLVLLLYFDVIFQLRLECPFITSIHGHVYVIHQVVEILHAVFTHCFVIDIITVFLELHLGF